MRRGASVLLVGLGVVGCRSYDESVFDERLRRATFNSYVETIGTQFGGLEPAGVTTDGLRDRFEDLAVRSTTPAAFYGVLRALLAELDDPHAALDVSPRFWDGPVAEPEWMQFVSVEGRVHVGLPRGNVRHLQDVERLRAEWLAELGALSMDRLDAKGAAAFLRLSAAFGPDFPGSERARVRSLTEPLAWLQLERIDGHEVETPHDAELLVRGALGSTVRLDVLGEGGDPMVLGVIRNAGVFEGQQATSGVRRRLHPLELAAALDPGGAVLVGARPTARAPRDAMRARRRLLDRGAMASAETIGPTASFGAFDMEAHRLRTPEGRGVAYLRIGTFRPRAPGGEGPPSRDISMAEPLSIAIEAMRGIDCWVIDLTSNPGGSWAEAGLLMSYFQDPAAQIVPHEVRSTSRGGNFLVRIRTLETHRLRRADVDRVVPSSLYVLVDQDTASAGEIVSSFLRGAAGAVLVGERTAGAEFSTGEFEAPDGSLLRIGLGGGMMEPFENFQGRGLEVDLPIQGASRDLEVWRSVFPLLCLEAALADIDARAAGARP